MPEQTQRRRFKLYSKINPMRRDGRRLQVGKGIYILPSLFTSGSLFCGFFAVTTSINATNNDMFFRSILAIIVASFLDSFDGRVARLTNTTSRFGMEYDSLSDLVSFGLAPAVTFYCWGLRDLGKLGWVGCFLFFACAALRLARFNSTDTVTAAKGYFNGLPTPAAALTLAATFILARDLWPDVRGDSVFLLGLTYVVAFLMVSNIRYRNFKDFDFRSKRSFRMLIAIVVSLAVLAWQTEIILFLLAMTYSLGLPMWRIVTERVLHREEA